jgi:hypothetical protein
VTFFAVLSDLHFRVKEKLRLADEPFKFSVGIEQPTGDVVWSLEGMHRALAKVDIKSIEYHVKNSDLANWVRTSLGEELLAEELESVGDLHGEKLRERLLDVVKHSQKEQRR